MLGIRLIFVLLVLFGASSLCAQEVGYEIRDENNSSVRGDTHQEASLDFSRFVAEGNGDLTFLRIQLRNRGERGVSGTCDLRYGGYRRREQERPVMSFEFVLAPKATATFECTLQGSGIADNLSYFVRIDGRERVWQPLGRSYKGGYSSRRSDFAHFVSAPAADNGRGLRDIDQRGQTVFLAATLGESSIRRLPENPGALTIWKSFEVVLSEGMTKNDFDSFREFVKAGGVLTLLVGEDVDDPLEIALKSLFEQDLSAQDILDDQSFLTAEMAKSDAEGALPAHYPSGLALDFEAIANMNRDGQVLRPTGRAGRSSFPTGISIYRLGAGSVLVFKLDLRDRADLGTFTRYPASLIGDRSGIESTLFGVDSGVDLGARAALPLQILVVLTLLGGLSLVGAVFFGFRKRRAIWLVPGVVVLSLVLVVLFYLTAKIYSAGAPTLARVMVSICDEEGAEIRRSWRDIRFGDDFSGTLTAPAGTLMIPVMDYDEGKQVPLMTIRDGSAELDLSRLEEGRTSTVLYMGGPLSETAQRFKIKVGDRATSIVNEGNTPIRAGVVFLVGGPNRQVGVFGPAAAGAKAEVAKVVGDYDLDRVLAELGLNPQEHGFLIEVCKNWYRTSGTTQWPSKALLVTEPLSKEVENAQDGENEIEEGVRIVVAPVS